MDANTFVIYEEIKLAGIEFEYVTVIMDKDLIGPMNVMNYGQPKIIFASNRQWPLDQAGDTVRIKGSIEVLNVSGSGLEGQPTDVKLIIIDMVTAPVRWSEWPAFVRGKVSNFRDRSRHPEFHKNLTKLVNHPDWKHMLKYNPIRSQHEMKWYLESRFPARKVDVINAGLHSRILAFDSGDMKQLKNIELTYP